MTKKHKILLRATQLILFAQAMFPFYFWEASRPGMYGTWTRAYVLLCALLCSICLVNAALIFWVQKPQGKRLRTFIGIKAAGLMLWLMWLLINIAKSGNAWIFLFLAIAFHLIFWVLADVALCFMVSALLKTNEPFRCNFCGTYCADSAGQFIRSQINGKGICDQCVKDILSRTYNSAVHGMSNSLGCDFCGKAAGAVGTVPGSCGGAICIDCCRICQSLVQQRQVCTEAMDLRNEAIRQINGSLTEEAIKSLDQALELSPKYSNAYNTRGYIYHNKEEFTKAIEDYSKALELFPEVEVYLNRGLAFAELMQFENAIADLSSALALTPVCSAYIWRGSFYIKTGQNELAYQDYLEMKKMPPPDQPELSEAAGQLAKDLGSSGYPVEPE